MTVGTFSCGAGASVGAGTARVLGEPRRRVRLVHVLSHGRTSSSAFQKR